MSTVKISLVSFVFFIGTALANPTRHVEVYSSDYPKDAFKKVPHTNVTFHRPYRSGQTLPKVDVRNKRFAKVVGLSEKIESWPEMKKDLLYMKARHSTLEELKKEFLSLGENQLVELKKIVTSEL